MNNSSTITLHSDMKRKFLYAKIKESWSQKISLSANDFMYLLLESYPNPPKDFKS